MVDEAELPFKARANGISPRFEGRCAMLDDDGVDWRNVFNKPSLPLLFEVVDHALHLAMIWNERERCASGSFVFTRSFCPCRPPLDVRAALVRVAVHR